MSREGTKDKSSASVLRVFVAVLLEQEYLHRLAAIRDDLAASGADYRWVSNSSFHITLKFIGNIAENRVKAVKDAISSTLEGHSSFEMSIEGIGGFPNGNRPRVVWAGIREGSKELVELAESVDEGLSELAIPKDRQRFVPHITLGRMRSPKGLGDLALKMSLYDWKEPLRSAVESVSLMKSVLTPRGAQYSVLERFALSGGVTGTPES